ncbi:latrophilin Cirl-like isoform X2 [Centruroides vittatus]|uniref:latrophilin Cirl-like isoform X2 n=1 Tax=Centruroides vittatus TaxID=120091 RepID=UPI00350FEA84
MNLGRKGTWLTSCFLCSMILFAYARKGERPQYRTAYACEESTLQISCGEGELIHLIRANFGRFSISICNEHGTLDWSVDCMSSSSFREMESRCGGKRRCKVLASYTVFGDPCPDTLKYLEAHYQCVADSPPPTTNRPSRPPLVVPPIHAPHESSTSSIQGVFDRSTTASVTNAKVSQTTFPFIFPSTPKSTTTKLPTTFIRLSSFSPIMESSSDYPTSTEDPREHFCSPVKLRNIMWNWTRAGEVSRQKCPSGSTGVAVWQCGMHPVRWLPEYPDLSDCNSLWVNNFEERIKEKDSLVNIAVELASITRDKLLYGGDILKTVSIIKKLVTTMEENVSEFSVDKRHQVVKELTQAVVDTSSNILDELHSDSWNDLPHSDQDLAASSLLRGLEQNALLLADTQNYNEQFDYKQDNVLVEVNVLQMHSVRDMTLPRNKDNSKWRDESSVYLSSQCLQENAKNGIVTVIFLMYNKLDEILDPDPPNAMYSSMQNLEKSVKEIVNSKILGVALGRKKVTKLSKPIIITLKHMQVENVTNPRCVFWNYERSEWSQKGCMVIGYNYTHTVCSCNHLTNFAILMDVQAIPLSYGHEVALRVITYVGCIVSIVCLFLTILAFQFLRGLKSDRTTIHKNLCACLLIAEIVFVGGIAQTHLPIICGIVAGLLHYFFLAAFSWMFLEGFQLYVMLIEVFETEKSRVFWYYLLAYGIPAIIVGISAAVDPSSYGTKHHCWLQANNYFIFSFVGPVIAILLANVVFINVAIYMMCRHANLVTALKNKEHAKLTNLSEDPNSQQRIVIMAWIRGAMVLIFLLGLTWTFGLLYLNQESVVMAYVFTVLNSLQGLFIFIFHCVKNDKVQKEYQKFVRQRQWLPYCFKRTRNQERKSSFYVQSNGTVSAPPTSGDQSSPRQSWSYRKDRKSSTSTSVLKLSSQDQSQQPIAFQHGQEMTLPHNRSNTCGRSFQRTRHLNKSHCGNIDDLSMADCSVIDSECVTEYCNKLGVAADIQGQPYGHLSENNKPQCMGDHIYESIEDEALQDAHKSTMVRCKPCQGHIRHHSSASHNSSASSNAEPDHHHPLLPPALPERNAITSLAHVLNSVPRHSSLPSSRERQPPSQPFGHSTSRTSRLRAGNQQYARNKRPNLR